MRQYTAIMVSRTEAGRRRDEAFRAKMAVGLNDGVWDLVSSLHKRSKVKQQIGPTVEVEKELQIFSTPLPTPDQIFSHSVFDIDVRDSHKQNPNIREVLEKLSVLTSKQREENAAMSKCVPHIQEKKGGVIPAYIEDKRVGEVVDELALSNPLSISDGQFLPRRSLAASRVLEIIAYDQILTMQNSEMEGITVLDGEKTLDFYHTRFPNGQIVKDEFNLSGIRGVKVPDYLKVRDGRIESVIEVTSTKNREYFARKYDAFQSAKESRFHGSLYRDATLEFLVPSDFLKIDATEIIQRFDSVRVGVIPNVEMRDVSRLVDTLYNRTTIRQPVSISA